MEKEYCEIVVFLIFFVILLSAFTSIFRVGIELALELSSVISSIASLLVVYRSNFRQLELFTIKEFAQRGVYAILLIILAILAILNAHNAILTWQMNWTVGEIPIRFSYGNSSENVGVVLANGNSTFFVDNFALPFANTNVVDDVVKMTNFGNHPYGIKINMQENNTMENLKIFEIYLILDGGGKFCACSIANGTMSFNDMPYIILNKDSSWTIEIVGQRFSSLNENILLSMNLRYWDITQGSIYYIPEPVEITLKPIP
jgi:hypothetical protein